MPKTRAFIAILALAALLWGCASSPPFAGMTAQEIYDESVRLLEEEDWDDAIAGFERILFGFPTFPLAAEARINLARAFYGKEQYLSAASEFTRALERFPTHEIAPRAALGVCRSYVALSPIPQRDQSYTEQAVQSCGNASADFQGTEEAQQAFELRRDMVEKLAEKDYQRGHYYLRRGFNDSAIIWFEDVLERYPDTPAAPKALLGMYDAYRDIGYPEDAAEARERLLSQYPDSPAARELRSGNADRDNGSPPDTAATDP